MGGPASKRKESLLRTRCSMDIFYGSEALTLTGTEARAKGRNCQGAVRKLSGSNAPPGHHLDRPQMPCPEVHPLPIEAPRPTSNPPATARSICSVHKKVGACPCDKTLC